MNEDQFLIWHAKQMAEAQKRFANMMIIDLKSLKGAQSKKVKNKRNELIEKYQMYINIG